MQKNQLQKTDPQILKSTEGTGIRRPRFKVGLACAPDSSMTKQTFKDECNINKIISKYQKTGALDHVNKYQPSYGFATAIDFRESMEVVLKGQEMFDALPSNLRKRFDNNPAEFLEFVQDAKNEPQLIELGLATRREQSPVALSQAPVIP